MALKDFLPKKEKTMITSVHINIDLYAKVKEKMKIDEISLHDLVHAAMTDYLSEVKIENKKSKS